MTNTPKPPRTLSDAELEQRRAASQIARQHATGPTSEEGKAASCRNAWKHGRYSAINRQSFGLGAASLAKLFGKPCLTTCPYHPDNAERTEHPCSLVLDGLTHAGSACLDKTVYVNALQALMSAMRDGEMDGMHGVLATQMASSLQMLDSFRVAISERGVMIDVPITNKDGDVVGFDAKLNPIVPQMIRFTESLGINFAELMATPRERERMREEDDAAGALQALLGGIAQRAQGRLPAPSPRTLEHED